MEGFWQQHGHQVLVALFTLLLFGGRVHIRMERNGDGQPKMRVEVWLAGNRYERTSKGLRMQRKTEGDGT